MTTPNDLIKITVFRPLDGLRTPYTISLDRMRNVVSDEIDFVELERIKSNPFLMARHKLDAGPAAKTDAHNALLQSQGLFKHITDTGVVISREPPDQWSEQFVTWLAKDQPNPFPDTEDLRIEYFEAFDDVTARIAEGNCPGCELTKTQVGFRIRVRERLGLA
jgi:hypothetical protein